MALTATASVSTRKLILENLCMYNYTAVVRIPNRLNIKYSVVPICSSGFTEAFNSIIYNIVEKSQEADKTIIFCSTYKDIVDVFEFITNKVGEYGSLFVKGKPLCDLFTASSHEDDKKRIIEDFTQSKSTLRLIVSTSAFGMGIDAPNIRHIIHLGFTQNY